MQKNQRKQLKAAKPKINLEPVNWKDFSPGPVVGLDEVGRGCIAGPVAAAAVVFSSDSNVDLYHDSKILNKKSREELSLHIQSHHKWAVGWATVDEIEKINILWASLLAMQRALESLEKKYNLTAGHLLVDGKIKIPKIKTTQSTIVKGDLRCTLIGAASIVAKVARDQHMLKLHEQFPQYNWLQNKGYPSPDHKQSVSRIGVSKHHRKTFAGVKEHLP